MQQKSPLRSNISPSNMKCSIENKKTLTGDWIKIFQKIAKTRNLVYLTACLTTFASLEAK